LATSVQQPQQTGVTEAAAEAVVDAAVAAVPVPNAIARQTSQEMILDELTASLKSSLEVEKLPLGLEAPTMVLDLDSFAEAVSNCVAGHDEFPNPSSDMPRFEAFDAPLYRSAPRSVEAPVSRSASGSRTKATSSAIEVPDTEMHWAPLNLKIASAALATVAVVTVASTVAMRRR